MAGASADGIVTPQPAHRHKTLAEIQRLWPRRPRDHLQEIHAYRRHTLRRLAEIEAENETERDENQGIRE